MKFNANSSLKRKLITILSLVAMAIAMFTCSSSFALTKPVIIIFYTNWNALSRQAVPAVQNAAAFYEKNVDFQKINIDDPTAPDKARIYGLTSPRTTPYVIVINKNGQVMYQGIYNNQTINQIDQAINNSLH